MKILLIEPFMGGHHGFYLQWIVQAFTNRKHDVMIATFEDSLDHPALQEIMSLQDEKIRLITRAPVEFGASDRSLFEMIRKMIKFRGIFRDFYRQAIRIDRVDFVMLPYLDYCSYAFAVMGSPFNGTDWAGLIMRTGFHHTALGVRTPAGRIDTVKERLYFRLLRNPYLRALFTIDPTLKDYTDDRSPPRGSRLVYLPDIAKTERSMSRVDARHALGIPQDSFLVLVYGLLSMRKGIEALMTAVEDSSFPVEGQLLFAGRQEAEVESFLSSPLACRLRASGRIHQINRHLDADEENTVFSAADVVWVGYRGHYHMSGVLVQAGVMGLPVLACEEGLIGWLTRRYASGLVVPASNPAAIARAIGELRRNSTASRKYGENGRLAYASHTLENFSRILVDAIDVRTPESV